MPLESSFSQAIAKELRRGGQVYYLHNNTNDIDLVADQIQKLFPDATIAIAHGKMQENELTDVWRRLTEGEVDILVCTTIIETGVDVPNANTLIIENADCMGLSQLHQLRGRVGRSTRRASAYCTFRKNKQLTEIADRRLSAIREFTQFGSGFKIAMRDLEIRGAGNLLGAQQHGHLASVGDDMYMTLLEEAVAEIKGTKEPGVPKAVCQIDIQQDAHIPESYISSYQQRLSVYKRIADIRNEEDFSDVLDELIDRWGEPPRSVVGLLKIPLIRSAAVNHGIYKIAQNDGYVCLYTAEIKPEITKKLAVLKGRIRVFSKGLPCYGVAIADSPVATLEEAIKALNAE